MYYGDGIEAIEIGWTFHFSGSFFLNYFHFGNSCLFVQFTFILDCCSDACKANGISPWFHVRYTCISYFFIFLYILYARVRNKPRAFLHFCIFRAGRRPSKKGTFVYIEWHTLALTKCCFPCFFSFPSSYLLNCRYIKQK